MDALGISKVTVNSPLGKVLRRNDPIIGREAVPYIKKKKILLTSRATWLDGEEVFTADGKGYWVKNVIWATGYQSDYAWLQVPGVIDQHGNPIHERGVTPIPGLYFLGLSWQYTRNSGLIRGVGTDALLFKTGDTRKPILNRGDRFSSTNCAYSSKLGMAMLGSVSTS